MIPENITTEDGLKLHTRHWQIENPKAVVVIAHGLGEHIGRYEHVTAAFNGAGYAAVGLDHRAHGKNEGLPRAFVTDIDLFVNDLYLLWQAVRVTYPDKPIFLLGHSMGGNIAVRFTLRHQNEMQGLVTTDAFLIADEAIPAAVVRLGKAVAQIAPGIPLTRVNSAELSHDPAVCHAYDADPLVFHERVRAGMAAALLRSGADALSRAHMLTIPILVLHGESDVVSTVRASQLLHGNAGSADKTLHIYPGMYHEILNEIENGRVLADIIDWLNRHLPRT